MIKKPKNKINYTVSSCLAWAYHQLKQAQIEAPERQARELLAHNSGLSLARLLSEPNQKLTTKIMKQYTQAIAARLRGFPMQYLLGVEQFRDMTLQVGKGVLIPRPETELIVDEVMRHSTGFNESMVIADLGTGSGNLALALARIFPHARVYGVDCSARALVWARRNRRRFTINNVHFLLGDGERPIPRKLWGHFSVVVSNPPYIPRNEISSLQREVQYEPRQALDGGKDGLQVIARMLAAATKLLHSHGVFVCEIGYGQGERVQAMFRSSGFSSVQATPDWQGIPRIVTGRLTS